MSNAHLDCGEVRNSIQRSPIGKRTCSTLGSTQAERRGRATKCPYNTRYGLTGMMGLKTHLFLVLFVAASVSFIKVSCQARSLYTSSFLFRLCSYAVSWNALSDKHANSEEQFIPALELFCTSKSRARSSKCV